MKIKLAILEQDSNYLKRITGVFNTRFADKLEVFAYTEEEAALSALRSAKINVFLAGDEFEIEVSELPNKCGFAYFVDEPSLEELHGQKTICKFQQAEVIYKQILNLYADKFQGIIGANGDAKTAIWWFCSAGGGCGATHVAAASAVHYAKKQKKVLFVELDEFTNAEAFFHGNGQINMNDLIFAIKGRKKNLSIKLESDVRQDEKTGVYYFAAPTLALDMNEITEEDAEILINEIRKMAVYDLVIIDHKLSLNGFCRKLWMLSNHMVMVADGTDYGNYQLARAIESMKVVAASQEELWMEKVGILYNKFVRDRGHMLEHSDIPIIGIISEYPHATTEELLQTISLLPILDKLQ